MCSISILRVTKEGKLAKRSEEFLMDISSREKSCWVVELEKELDKLEDELSKEKLKREELNNLLEVSGRNPHVIFRVSRGFVASDQQFYVPEFISIGPYHFENEKFRMEPHKTEAVGRMQQRIPGRSIRSIVETEVVAMDTSIREFYEKELSYSAIAFAWIVTRDSCFFFEFMLNYLRRRQENFHDDCVVEGRYDAVFSLSVMNIRWRNILNDLALFENQIPFSVLERLLAHADVKSDPQKILGDILSEVASLYDNRIFTCGMKQQYNKEKTLHFLEFLYYSHVGWDLASYKEEAYTVKEERLFHFSWITSIFSCCCPMWMKVRGGEDVRYKVKVSAADLKKKGVKLCAVTSKNSTGKDSDQAIRWVRFEEKTSTLYLPIVSIDLFRHSLLRNFIALEYTSEKYRPAPITSFAFFMDELVDSEEDIAVLREANIIKNCIGSNKEVTQCFNALIRSDYLTPGCKPIDHARMGLQKYARRKYKILWSEFLSTYFAKPWLVAGSIAATLLIFFQVIQFFCRFYTCNRKA